MKKNRKRGIIITLLTLIFCVLVSAAVLTRKPEPALGATGEENTGGMPVSTITVLPGTHRAILTSLGEVRPRWQSLIRSEVDGKIVFLSEKARTGMHVQEGEILLRIDKSRYEMQLYEAENRLATARINLLMEQQEAREAQRNWTRSGLTGAPDSPLVLREPQLRAAELEVKAAEAAWKEAAKQRDNTEIRAPYNGIITQLSVNPGEILFAGDEVFLLSGTDQAEIGLQLDADQWSLLGDPSALSGAFLADPGQNRRWAARIDRASGEVNKETRLRTLFLSVDDPTGQDPPLLPGSFLQAEIPGREVDGLLRLPASALTGEGLIWQVDETSRLVPHQAEVVFYTEKEIYVKAPEQQSPGPCTIVTAPHGGFNKGLLVQVREERGN